MTLVGASIEGPGIHLEVPRSNRGDRLWNGALNIFDDVRNVTVYGLKTETLAARGAPVITPVLVRGSSDFRFFGQGGNAVLPEGQPLYRIENCTNFLLINFTHQFTKKGADASTWFMVEEIMPDGSIVRTPGTEYFALYKMCYMTGNHNCSYFDARQFPFCLQRDLEQAAGHDIPSAQRGGQDETVTADCAC